MPPPLRVVVACAALWVASVVVTLDGMPETRVTAAAVQGLVVAMPMLVGLASWGSGARFPRLLLVAGAGLAIAGWSASPEALLYSIGRVGVWLLIPGVVYLVLAFPAGRLGTSLDRVLFAAAGLTVTVLCLLPLPFTAEFPVPSPWATCEQDCPANSFAVVGRQPAVMDDVVVPVREVAVMAIAVAVGVLLARRTAAARPLLRAALVPALLAAILHMVLLCAFFAARQASVDSDLLRALGWAYVVSLPVLAAAFAAGRIVRDRHGVRALRRLADEVRNAHGPGDLAFVLSGALEDPSLRLYRCLGQDGGHWIDEAGRPVEPPAPGTGVTAVSISGQPPIVLRHDPVLDEDQALVQAAGEIALLHLHNEHLVERLTRSLEELTESRSRLLEIGDRERRSIERDLHDGAQQGLVSLRIRLSLLQERLSVVAPAEVGAVETLAAQVEEAIDQVRSLARGIYPPLLAAHGLKQALQSAGRASPVATTVEVRQSTRYRMATESTIYFTCLEAMQNAAKHARGATYVHVLVREEGDVVHFEVRDDGAGFSAGATSGSGLANLRDRVAAASGTLDVVSEPGAGTQVKGTVPLRPALRDVRKEPVGRFRQGRGG